MLRTIVRTDATKNLIVQATHNHSNNEDLITVVHHGTDDEGRHLRGSFTLTPQELDKILDTYQFLIQESHERNPQKWAQKI